MWRFLCPRSHNPLVAELRFRTWCPECFYCGFNHCCLEWKGWHRAHFEVLCKWKNLTVVCSTCIIILKAIQNFSWILYERKPEWSLRSHSSSEVPSHWLNIMKGYFSFLVFVNPSSFPHLPNSHIKVVVKICIFVGMKILYFPNRKKKIIKAQIRH